jgi:hypothetical protein
MGDVAMQVTFLTSCLCLAILLAAANRLFAPAKVSRVLHPTLGLIGFFAWLICWLYFGLRTDGWLLASFALAPPLVWVLLAVTGAVGYVVARQPRVTLPGALIFGAALIIHFGFWFVAFVGRVFWLPMGLVSAGLAGKGVLWLSRANTPTSEGQRNSREVGWGSVAVIASISLGMLMLIWAPPRDQGIAGSRDSAPLTITLRRGGGFGGAPAYSITIHRDGRVAYSGQQMVAVKGSRTGSVRVDQVQRIIASLDRINFLGLDGRAFLICPDAPYAAITVSAGGREKTVASTNCGSAETAAEPQAAFLRAAQEIDNSVGSERWTRCDGPCQP